MDLESHTQDKAAKSAFKIKAFFYVLAAINNYVGIQIARKHVINAIIQLEHLFTVIVVFHFVVSAGFGIVLLVVVLVLF